MQKSGTNIILTLCLFLMGIPSLWGQNTTKQIYFDAKKFTLIGKITETPEFYHRVDTAKYREMPRVVKSLFTNSSGLAIMFKTNSNAIYAKWSTANPNSMSNMTDIAHKGLDLYIKRDNKWVFAGVGRPTGNSTKTELVSGMTDDEKECLLYLPLYDELKSLEIGISENCYVEALPNPFRHRVLIYGSSITQGASASRPGMAYPSRMSRSLGIEFINFGLSGNGKMEKTVADMIKEMDADAYILDCVPNPNPKEITERTAYLVTEIRKHHPEAPIILVSGGWRENANFNIKSKELLLQKNENFKNEYSKLKDSGVKNLYYIEGNILGDDHEGTADSIHPNDLGFDRMIQSMQPAIAQILQQHGIK